jgi:hypothetical protein
METMGYWRPTRPRSRPSLGGLLGLVGLLEDVLAGLLVVELAGGGVEGDGDLFAGLVAGFSMASRMTSMASALDLSGREAAFVADGGVVALLLEHAFEGVEDFDAPAQGVGEGLGADGHDHELLEVDVRVGVGAAVEDVHHGGGQDAGVDAAEVAIEGSLSAFGGGAGGGHGDGEDGVGAEACPCSRCRRWRSWWRR